MKSVKLLIFKGLTYSNNNPANKVYKSLNYYFITYTHKESPGLKSRAFYKLKYNSLLIIFAIFELIMFKTHKLWKIHTKAGKTITKMVFITNQQKKKMLLGKKKIIQMKNKINETN